MCKVSNSYKSYYCVIIFYFTFYIGIFGQLSEKPLLPDDPEKAKKYVEDANHSKHPVRMACGHWFLLKPMDEHIRSPPFVHYCPVSVLKSNWNTRPIILHCTGFRSVVYAALW